MKKGYINITKMKKDYENKRNNKVVKVKNKKE